MDEFTGLDCAGLSVVVVDDDPKTVSTILRYLRPLKCAVRSFTDPAEALVYLETNRTDIVITDLKMPRIDGLTIVRKTKEWNPSANILLISGCADDVSVRDAMELGAFDFFEKPVKQADLLDTIRRTVKYYTAVRERDNLAEQLSFVSRRDAERWGVDGFVGRSPAMERVLRDIRLLQGKANISVLITGESGTGKELVARAIHFGSPRAERPFVPVNCSALPVDLAESALFGHVKGSFTGATTDRKGAFELAENGTLFLDEIGDMAPTVQTKLLRVLEDGMVCPVGKTVGRKVDVRVIAATNCDLQQRLGKGSFRTDLYYRLAGFAIEIPPLRQRKEDIPLLARHFIKLFSGEMGINPPELSPEVVATLEKHDFPGNVRELRNLIERMLIETGGRNIRPSSLHFLDGLPLMVGSPSAAEIELPPKEDAGVLSLADAEKLAVQNAMTHAGGNVSVAARLLGVSRNKLYRKLRAMGESA